MALASRILSKSKQICKLNTASPIMLLKNRRYFSTQSLDGHGVPSANDQAFPHSPKSSTELFSSTWTSYLKAHVRDLEHWRIYTEPLGGASGKDEKIHYYIKTLAQVLGSEEDAVRKIYSVATREEDGYAFGANVSNKIADAIKDLKNVTLVVPDAYNPIQRWYPWDPFINGQALQRDPKRHQKKVRISPNRRLFPRGGKQ